MKFNLRPSNDNNVTRKGNKGEMSYEQDRDLHPLNRSSKYEDMEHNTDASDRAGSIYGGVGTAVRPNTSFPETSNGDNRDEKNTSDRDSEWSPSIQNLLDKPTAAFPRHLLLGGMAFCVAFGTWAWFGEINDVGQARGELVHKGDVYKVNPVEMGKVAKIAVEEGETVKAGEAIAELDTELAAAEVDRLQEQLTAYEVQLVQKQGPIEKTKMEAESRAKIAEADIKAQYVAIAQARKNVETTRSMLKQLQADAAAQEKRRQSLQPLVEQAEKLLAQLQTDVEAQQERREVLEPLQQNTQKLIAQLQADVAAQQERQDILEPLEEKSQQLIEQLKLDVAEQQERVDRLKPLVDEGAVSKDHLFQVEQSLRDRQNALIRAQMSEATQAKEQVFQAEQALRDRQTAALRAQLTEATQAKERLLEAKQAQRDRQTALIRAQMSEVTVAKERLFEVEQALSAQQQRMTETQGKLEQAQTELKTLQAQLEQKQAEKQRIAIESQQRIEELELDLTQLKAKIGETRNLIASAKTKLKQRFLYAPVDGVVLSLDISNTGEVIQPGQTIAAIAPTDAPLVLSASVPNPEAGFIKTGMKVQVKFDAYPYQDYGIITGKVTSVSPASKADEQLGEVYKIEIALDRNYVTEKNEKIYFKPGQTASADIIIRNRRIVDILLDPIRQLKEGGINL